MKHRLVHGTRAANLSYIATHGLTPRGEADSNWSKAPSRTDRVYLTGPYGLYFAAASLLKDGSDLRGAILSIDFEHIKPELLRADEDVFVQLAQAHGVIDDSEIYEFSQNDFSEHDWAWDFSLAKLGNCAYAGTIPVEGINKVAVIDFNRELYTIALDPTITIINTLTSGGLYMRLTDWVFTGDHPYNELFGESADPATFKPDRVSAYKELHERHIRVYDTVDEALYDLALPKER